MSAIVQNFISGQQLSMKWTICRTDQEVSGVPPDNFGCPIEQVADWFSTFKRRHFNVSKSSSYHSNHHHVFNNFCLPLPIPLKPGISVIIRKINQSQPSLISLLIFCHPPIKIIKILITFINWWSNQAAYRGSCYELVLSPTSASAAEADCVKKGGHLLSITSE